jgi:peptidyl-prolyl cis-trans isomerase SurA
MRNTFMLLVLILSLGTATAQKQIVDKVVATIGGEFILLSELEAQFALMEDQQGVLPPEARCSILDQLLAGRLLLNQSKLDSIEVSDSEIEDQLDARIERILSYMNNDISQFEDYYGQTVNEVKETFREDLRNQLLVERMRAQIISEVKVTPSEVKKFFASIPRDSLPYFSAEVEVGEIVYKPTISTEERERSIKQLENIRQRIVEGGEDFAALAQRFSDDGSARGGGDLGWSKRGKFVAEFEAAAYKLEENEISPVVESQFGFHLIQLLGRRGNSIHVRHILIKPEITDTDIERARVHLDSVRNLIVSDSITFSQAVKEFSDEDVQSYNNDGRMVNPLTGNTFFEIGDLEPDIYFTIDTMKVGQLSAPFEYAGPTGEPMLRIVQLQSRTAPHQASLEQDYSKIQKAAIESKKNEYISTWIESRVDATFINIDGMYDGCPNLSKWRGDQVKP